MLTLATLLTLTKVIETGKLAPAILPCPFAHCNDQCREYQLASGIARVVIVEKGARLLKSGRSL
jgi:hypothetical protein